MKKLFLALLCVAFIFGCVAPPTTKPDKIEMDKEIQPTGFLWLKWGERENIFHRGDCTFDTDLTQTFLNLSVYKCYDIKEVNRVSGFEYKLFFYKNQFFMGSLLFSKSHLDFLTKELYTLYGPPTKTDLKKDLFNPARDMYSRWRVGNVLIIVSSNLIDRQAQLKYVFLPIGAAVNYRLDQDNQEPLFEE